MGGKVWRVGGWRKWVDGRGFGGASFGDLGRYKGVSEQIVPHHFCRISSARSRLGVAGAA